jgi:hypothetical protein
LLALTTAFFMPWITIGTSAILGSAGVSYSYSYSFADLCGEVIAKSSLGRAVQQILGTTHDTRSLPIDSNLQSRLWTATMLAVVFYFLSVVYAVVYFIRGAGFYLLSSAAIAIASAISAFFAVGFFKQQIVEWGELLAFLLNVRLDMGAWVTLVAGFILAGSYALSREDLAVARQAEVEPMQESRPNAQASTMFCRECGSEIPRDSRFCKECGAKLA